MVESVQETDKKLNNEEVKSLIESSQKAVGEIDKKDIQLIKSFDNPPSMIKHVLYMCYIMFHNKTAKDYQDVKNTLLANPQVLLDQLQAVDVYKVPQKSLDMMKKIVTDNGITLEKVKQSSQSCGGIFEFLNNVLENTEFLKEE